MEVFVVLSFRWLNLEGFYAYTIQQKKPSHFLQGLYDRGFGKFQTFQKLIIRQSEEGFYALLSWSFKPPRFPKPWRFLWCCRFVG
ncbi:MAG: hypothetical protein GDA51_04290 [Ekhidna sp.]|nr:hypothetical protein [Ekhidna sp.]